MKKNMGSIAVHYRIALGVVAFVAVVIYTTTRKGRAGGHQSSGWNERLFKEAQTYHSMSVDASDMRAALSSAHYAAAYLRLVDQTALRNTHNVTDAAQQIQSRVQVLEGGRARKDSRQSVLP